MPAITCTSLFLYEHRVRRETFNAEDALCVIRLSFNSFPSHRCLQAVDLTTPVAVRPTHQYGGAMVTAEAEEVGRLREQLAELQRSVMQKEDSLSAMTSAVNTSQSKLTHG